MYRNAFLAFSFAVLATGAQAQSARDVVAGADRVRNPGHPFRVSATVIEYKSGQPIDRNVFTVFSKLDPATGQFRDVMLYAEPPRDAGKMLLLNGGNLWFYDPAAQQSVRISPQQKLTGQASAGDVLTENLAVDYNSAILDTQTIEDGSRQQRICWHLELKAANDAATYNRVEYWVEQGSYYPIKAKFYADSGGLLKVLYYRAFEKRADRIAPTQAVIIDAVDSTLVTTVDFGEPRFQDIPDSWFQRDYLPHLKLDLMIARAHLPAAMLLCLVAQAAQAQTDPDLNRIPAAASPQPTSAPSPNDNIYLQSDLTLSGLRGDLAVPLPPPTPQWEARIFLDTRLRWQIGDDFSFAYSGRFNLRAEDGLPGPGHENVHNDLREAYLSWAGGDGLFLELGRINLKSGVAEGFNPTDFFKTRAVVEPTSADPSVLREDRLGTVMLQAQAIWPGGSLTVAMAPKLTRETPPYTNLPSFDPMLDRTNAHGRMLVKASVDLFDDVSPEFLAYDEDGRMRFGVNITKGFGQAIVAYLEGSGGRRASLADDAFADGRRANILPSSPIAVSGARFFASDLALGLSYATQVGLNFDLEYDYHQAGFSAADWRNWFNAGALNSGNPVALDQLWFIRGYATDQQEPMARSSLFLRADWQNAFVHNLALAGFVDTDLHDGSGLAQFSADYYLSPRWTVGALADVYFGRRRSDFGSLPQSVSVLAKISRYF